MTKSKRNLFVSVLVLILTVAIAGGSTYAWFTTNKNVTIADMDVNVTTGTQGLYVAPLVTGPYKSYLSADDLVTAGFVKENIVLDNVTSADGKVFKDRSGNVLTHLGPNPTAGAKAGWVEFTIFFQATGQEGDSVPVVNLSKLEMNATGTGKDLIYELDTVLDATAFGNTTGITTGHATAGTIANGEKIPGKAINAARMSFVNGTGAARVWDPHKKDTTTFRGKDPFNNMVLAENFAVHYFNALKVKQKLPNEQITAAPTLPATEEDTVFKTNVLTLAWDTDAKAFRTSLTIRMWLEGFDGDCTNAIFADSIKTKMVFTVQG